MNQSNGSTRNQSIFSETLILKEHLYVKEKVLQDFLLIPPIKVKDLVIFHRNHKYLFMSYNPILLKNLGSIVANKKNLTVKKTYQEYQILLTKIFKEKPTQKNRLNTLYHIYGYFKNKLDKETKTHYFNKQNAYMDSKCSFSSVLSLLKDYSDQFEEDYLVDQKIFSFYLNLK